MARLPFTDNVRSGAGKAGLSPFAAGLIALVVVVAGAYFAFTRANPFSSPYELNAVVRSANEMKPRSPVRVAGVDVGVVKEVVPLASDDRALLPREGGEGFARVRMEITDDEALPIKEDATMKIRSRIFLEGNYFVELHPGTPSAEELDSGSTLPPNQTAFPVQQHQVLQDVFRRDQRDDFRTIFDELSTAFAGRGAAGFNQAIRYWEPAWRDTAAVNEAYLGLERHDLSRLLRTQGRVFGALSRNEEALKGFVTNLNRTMGAFAVQEDNLRATIPQLRDVLRVGRPALRSLNDSLPSLRAFAREAVPGTRAAVPALDAQIPLMRQLRLLVRPRELQGLARDLRRAIPHLVKLNRGSARTFRFTRALSSCQNNVLVPFATEPIPDPDFRDGEGTDEDNDGEPWYQQTQRAFVGLSGESRLFDGNSSFFRVQAGGGPVQLLSPGRAGENTFTRNLFQLQGVRPAAPSKRPGFRPDQPCELQEVPNLHAPGGPPAETEIDPEPTLPLPRSERVRRSESNFEWAKVVDHMRRQARGQRTFDPFVFNGPREVEELRRLGLVRLKNGRLEDARRARQADIYEFPEDVMDEVEDAEEDDE